MVIIQVNSSSPTGTSIGISSFWGEGNHIQPMKSSGWQLRSVVFTLVSIIPKWQSLSWVANVNHQPKLPTNYPLVDAGNETIHSNRMNMLLNFSNFFCYDKQIVFTHSKKDDSYTVKLWFSTNLGNSQTSLHQYSETLYFDIMSLGHYD